MRRAVFAAVAAGAVITSALGIGATHQNARPIDVREYAVSLAGIEAARELVLARCDLRSGAAKEMCRAQAGAREAIREADLEASFRRTPAAAREAQRARIEARYLVERARCATLGGPSRDQCQINAHASRGRALLTAATPYATRG
jgi:hypothetical protein